jgi:chaperonin GroEL
MEYIKAHAQDFRDEERREVEKRIARLAGKVAIIRTHSTTEEEAKEKRDRFEDAIYAAQAALKEGVVTGGGMTFLRVAKELPQDTDGGRLLAKVFEEPMRQIAFNAGKNVNEVITTARKTGQGYNARTDSYGDLDKMGVVDPLPVLKHAFDNALSVSILAITTEVLVNVIEEPKK